MSAMSAEGEHVVCVILTAAHSSQDVLLSTSHPGKVCGCLAAKRHHHGTDLSCTVLGND